MKTPYPSLMFGVLAALSFLCLTASAEDKKAAVNASDEKFIKTMAETSKVELSISELAMKKATRDDVKNVASTLFADHTTASEGLAALSTGKGVQLSAVIEPSGAAKFRELEKLSGKPFDDGFLTHVAAAHRRLVASLEDAAKDATDADLKAFVGKTLPTMRGHLDKVSKMLPDNTPPAPIPPI